MEERSENPRPLRITVHVARSRVGRSPAKEVRGAEMYCPSLASMGSASLQDVSFLNSHKGTLWFIYSPIKKN